MLRRKAYETLMAWKDRKHKCLLVKGRRQVGKTYIIREFASENYENFIELNLMEEKRLHKAFDGDLDVKSILLEISSIRPDLSFKPGSTLILLDEIQECPRARTSLKSFTEDGRFDVIAAGSLLGVSIPGKDIVNAPVPVGYEEQMTMHSLDFEEFLWAEGMKDESIAILRGCLSERKPIPPALLQRLWDAYRDFTIVGGMPESVQTFVDSGNYGEAGKVLDAVIDQSKADMKRYNTPVNGVKVMSCFDSIPAQLAASNKKFMYSRIENDGSRRSREKYGNSLVWMIAAGYGNPCRKLESLDPPLMARTVPNCFKLYMSDTGMLVRMYGERTMIAIHDGDPSSNLGAVTENEVAECLSKSGYIPRYYSKNKGDGRMELDFVIELGAQTAVLEVKSGKKREYPSLNKVCGSFKVDRRMVLEKDNVHVTDDGIEHYPLFAAAFMDSLREPRRGPGF